MESSGPAFGNVTARLVRVAVDRARSRRVPLSPDGRDAVGELATRAAQALQEQELLTDEPAIERAEQSIQRLIDRLPVSEFERREARYEPPVVVGEGDVMQAFAGLCPGLWPIC
jgi:hypothetical protein